MIRFPSNLISLPFIVLEHGFQWQEASQEAPGSSYGGSEEIWCINGKKFGVNKNHNSICTSLQIQDFLST